MTLERLAEHYDAIGGAGAARLSRQCRLLFMPLDLDGLVAEGKLRRLSARRYEVLADLPDAVWAQARGFAQRGGRTILTF
jgi:hypothetical protein